MTLRGLLIVLFLSSSLFGRARVSGYCEQGGQVVVTAAQQSTTKVQQSYPSCSITVYLTGTVTSATIYADNSGTSLANPFSASKTGYWFFYADNGTYDVKASGGGIPAPITWGAIAVIDSATSPVIASDVYYKSQGMTLAQGCSAASSAGLSLSVSLAWQSLTTHTYGCQMAFNGGSLQTASGQTITVHVQSAPLSQIFDTLTSGGTIIAYGPNGVTYPAWYGVKCDATGYTGGTDDTAAIQAAFNGVPNGLNIAPNIATTIMFTYGRCRMSDHIVVPPGKFITVTAPAVPNGNSAATYLWQTDPNKNILDDCVSPTASFSVTNMGFAGPAGTYTAGTANGICLGSSAQGIFDSTIAHNYFIQMPNAGIYAVSQEGYDIADNVSELGAYFFLCPQGATQCDNNRIHDNWMYGHRKAGVYFAIGIDNAIRNNQFYLNGDTTNSFGAIVINSTTVSGADPNVRNSAITANTFHQNNYDIVLRGTSNAGGNEGIVGVLIADNTSDFDDYSGIYVNTAAQVKMIGNRIHFSSFSMLNTYPGIDIEGNSDQIQIDNNSVSLDGGLGAIYGLQTGASTTAVILGINHFEGQTASVNLLGSFSPAIIYKSLTVNGTLTCTVCAITQKGTFTPVLAFGGASTGITYSAQLGAYSITGSQVTVEIGLTLTSKGTATGAATISGLPFPASSIINSRFNGTVGFTTNMSSISSPGFDLPGGATTANLFNSGATGSTGFTNSNFGDTSVIILTITYFID